MVEHIRADDRAALPPDKVEHSFMEAGFADGRVGMDGYVYQLHLPLASLHEGFESIGIGVVDLQAQRGIA